MKWDLSPWLLPVCRQSGARTPKEPHSINSWRRIVRDVFRPLQSKRPPKIIAMIREYLLFYTSTYVAIPPVSHELPPGDKAELATDGNHVNAFLTGGSQTCARFLVPDFLIQVIKRAEGGKSSLSGGGI